MALSVIGLFSSLWVYCVLVISFLRRGIPRIFPALPTTLARFVYGRHAACDHGAFNRIRGWSGLFSAYINIPAPKGAGMLINTTVKGIVTLF
jgi:hypothetical protein